MPNAPPKEKKEKTKLIDIYFEELEKYQLKYGPKTILE